MSNPENILSDFQSHAYHHTLIVCNSYNTAEALSNTNDISVFRRDQDSIPYDIKRINNNSALEYVVLIDTMTDVRFSLKTATWNTVLAPKHESTTGMKYSDTIEVDGELEIVEPFGIELYSVMANISRDLSRDPASLVFLLKTFFVGHRSDGTEEIIANVRPFVFTLLNMTSSIDQSGTIYKLSIVGSSNGMAKLPQHQRAGEKVSVTIAPDDTVASMLAKIQSTVQAKYDEYKRTTFEQIRRASTDKLSTADLSARFQDVVYTFGADAVYDTAEYQVGGTKGNLESNNLSSGPNGTIESLLRRVINSCPQCDADGSGKNADNTRYLHKIVSFPRETNDGKLEIRHEIHRFAVPTQTRDGNTLDPSPGEFIEFDYTYTGKNIDVLEFDLKMDMGLSFFYTLANAKHIPSTTTEDARGIAQRETTQGPSISPTSSSLDRAQTDDKDVGFPTTRVPLYMGRTIDDPMIKNKRDPLTAASFESALERAARLEHVEAHITIIGNPNLLDEIIDTSGNNEQSRRVAPIEGNTGALNITRTPALLKVNVRFPNSSEFEFDESTQSGVKEFWYRGFYMMRSIQQIFHDGLFTQKIEMYSVQVVETEGIDKASQLPTNYETPTPILASAIPRSCGINTFPYEIIQGVSDSPHVTPEFIERVEIIANNLNTLPEWLLAVMSFETGGSFDPALRNPAPGSTATGLIQFLASTAIGLGTTVEQLAQMTSVEQLTFVEKYFRPRRRGLTSLEGVYTAVLAGTPMPDPSTVLYSAGSTNYNANQGLDFNNNGEIEVGEAATLVTTRLFTSTRTVQRRLKQSNISQSAKDGITLGLNNQGFLDAILEYQILHGLTPTGYLGDESGRHLFGIPQHSTEECEPHDRVNDTSYPLSQQYNNPLLVRRTAFTSLGEVPSDGVYAKFKDPQHGLRAAYVLLRAIYFQRRDLRTVELIVNRWAPQTDNDPKSISNYINNVSNAMGISPQDQLNLDDDEQLIMMAKAMAVCAGGPTYQPYPDSIFREALALYPR